MSDGSLSQEEIDALLMGDAPAEPVTNFQSASNTVDESTKTKIIQLFSGKIGNEQNSILSELVVTGVRLSKPRIEADSRDELILKLPEQIIEIRVDFQGGIEGRHAYLLSEEDAIKIAAPVMGHDDLELEPTTINAVGEAMGQLASTTANTLGENLGQTIIADGPSSNRIASADIGIDDQNSLTLAYNLDMGKSGTATIYEMFDENLASKLVAGPDFRENNSSSLEEMTGMSALPDDDSAFQQLMPNLDLPNTSNTHSSTSGNSSPNVLGVELSELSPTSASGEKRNIGLLMDVSMELTVELGRTKWKIKDILGMGEGTIIELDKLAGEPVDILVNRNLIARGEVVVIDENFGVRITEIVSTSERFNE